MPPSALLPETSATNSATASASSPVTSVRGPGPPGTRILDGVVEQAGSDHMLVAPAAGQQRGDLDGMRGERRVVAGAGLSPALRVAHTSAARASRRPATNGGSYSALMARRRSQAGHETGRHRVLQLVAAAATPAAGQGARLGFSPPPESARPGRPARAASATDFPRRSPPLWAGCRLGRPVADSWSTRFGTAAGGSGSRS
jgi:hypothetical protein